jgi:hypothetical protein
LERSIVVSDLPAMDAGRTGGYSPASLAAFAIGLGLYLFVQLGLVAAPIVLRPVPPGTADSYLYISKAAQLGSCFTQSCPALEDLRREVAIGPDTAPETAKRRTITVLRIFQQYHLLHAALIAGLHEIGLGWEAAINAVSLAGAMLAAAGVAWLLVVAFGPGAAGLALVILAFAVHPGYHGLHWIVPSNVALGIGLVTWAAVLARIRAMRWVLPVAVLAMVWMHPIGRIYGLAALGLYFVCAPGGSRRQVWITLGFGIAAVASPTIAAALTARPALTYETLRATGDRSFLEGVRKNLAVAGSEAHPWLFARGGIAVLVLALVALIIELRDRRWGTVALGGLAVGFVAAGLGFVLPNYPGELFNRLAVPVAVIVTGLAASALWRWGAALGGRGGDARPWTPGRMFARLAGGAAAAGLALYIGIGSVHEGSSAVLDKVRYMTYWGLMPLDRAQPRRVLAALPADGRIAYLDEPAFTFYAAHGGLSRGAALMPIIEGTPLEAAELGAAAPGKTELRGRGRIVAAVAAIEGFWGYDLLQAGRPVVIESRSPVDWSGASVFVDARGKPLELMVQVGGDVSASPAAGRQYRVVVPAGGGGWVPLPLPADARGSRLAILRTDSGSEFAWLQGIRLDAAQTTVWPWDRGIAIAHWLVPVALAAAASGNTPAEVQGRTRRVKRVRLESSAVVPKRCRSLGIIADMGATVASRVACGAR